jgi:hypothetical protein
MAQPNHTRTATDGEVPRSPVRYFTRNATDVPVSMDAARDEFAQVAAEMHGIQAQLSSRAKPAGKLPPADFHAWKSWHDRASGALQMKVARYRFLKGWIRDQSGVLSNHQILARLVLLMDEIIGDDDSDLTPESQRAIRELRECFLSQPSPA